MKLAFCLFNYFPYGGLQRDFLHIAKAAHARGHEIHVYTMSLEGALPDYFHVHLLEKKGRQNHTRCQSYIDQLTLCLSKTTYDKVVGFNKMPHLDFYYAADVCYQARIKKSRNIFYRLLPRYHTWVQLEKSVFSKGKKTNILLLSETQQKEYASFYQTESNRFSLLPPGIDKKRFIFPDAIDRRKRLRFANGITEKEFLLLMVGSGFKTKGVDRAIKSLAALPADLKNRCHFFVIGQDRPASFIKLAKNLGVNEQVVFLGGRQDVPDFLLAADLLLHPAYHENTGTVILEAILSGLPVLTVDVCGYAHYVTEAKAGVVLSSPFSQEILNHALETMLLSPDYSTLKTNGPIFANSIDISSMCDKAVDLIEALR